MQSNNSKDIEQIERYLNEEMDLKERLDFEHAINNDKELQVKVDQQRLMVEGIRLAALQKEREELKILHQQILAAPSEEAVLVPMRKKFPWNWTLSIAAVLLIGVWLGGNLEWLNVGSIEVVVDNYGNQPGGLPDFGVATVPMVKKIITNTGIQDFDSSVPISLYICPSCGTKYEVKNNQLVLFTPDLADFNPSEIQVLLIEMQQPNTKVALLKYNQRPNETYQIPLNHEDFQTLWNL